MVLSSIHERMNMQEVDSDSEEEFYSPSESPSVNMEMLMESNEIYSYQVLLAGNDFVSKCLPHIIHVYPLSEGVNLVTFIEIGKEKVSSKLYETFTDLHTMQIVQIQGDKETLRPAFEKLDSSVKKLCEGLKKIKNNSAEVAGKQLLKKWEFMRKKYLDFIKNHSSESLLRAETSTAGLLDNLKEILHLTSYNENVMIQTQEHAVKVSKMVKEKLEHYSDFFKIKVFRNFSLGSYPFCAASATYSCFC